MVVTATEKKVGSGKDDEVIKRGGSDAMSVRSLIGKGHKEDSDGVTVNGKHTGA